MTEGDRAPFVHSRLAMAKPDDSDDLTAHEQAEVEEGTHPRAQVLYEAVRREGEHELGRPVSALAWSGLAAGLSMGFSMVAMALTQAALPHAPWRKLVSSFGYCVGFVIVIVARQQLFTENTITPVIPWMRNRDRHTAVRLLRLWATVLVTNVLGTCAFAFILKRGGVLAPEVDPALSDLAARAMAGSAWMHFVRAIFAGWLIALMVWMLARGSSRAFIVVLVTYLVALADLSHVIAGSTEAFYAVFDGQATIGDYFGRFLVPVALGNMVGGITLVAALSHAQVAADASGRTERNGERPPESSVEARSQHA